MNRFSFGVAIALAVLGFVWSATAAAATEDDDAPRVKIGWTQQPPELDGRLTPGEWSDAAHIDGLTQATPSPGDAPSQRTEIWIMTDGESLFIGARLWDTNPEDIVALRMLRDGDTRLDDRFGITIDPFLDRQNGYFFQVNANGVRRDFLIEGTTIETSWDARWFVKTSVDAEGWTAEIAVPFSSINFDANADVWGLNMARGIRRNDEIDRWSDPVLERFLTSMGRAGYLEGMTGIKQGLGIQIVPNATLSRVENEVDNTGDTEFEPSLDAFYKVTPALTTALTVNTDFSEVEVDERQVNLTRFGLFFPEKRDFFLQDALIFNFGEIEQNGRPFFSRRIGLGGNGEIRDIIAGAKVTGRAGPIKIGIVDVVVDERARVDQANLLVARLATSVFGESTVGAIVTHGNPEANGDNTVIGGDFVYRNNRFLDNKSINASIWVQGSFSDPDSILVPDPNAGDIVDGSGLAYGGRINYPNDRIRWSLGFSEFQDEFNPALGFVNRVGIREYDGEFRFRTRPRGGLFRTVDTTMNGRIVTSSNATNTLRSSEFNFFPVILTTPILDSIEFRYVHSYEFTSRSFSSLQIGPGEYHFDEGRIKIATSGNRRISGELEVAHGTFFDGTRTRVTSDIEIRPIKYLLLGGQYEFNDIRLPGSDLLSTANDQDRDAQIHVVRGRLNLYFTPEISLLTLVQFDNVSDGLGFNSRLRWILQEGREIFIVVNQGADTEDDVRATRTELIAKLQWTFTF